MNQPIKKLWFKQHDYGLGWTPTTWQGWLTLAAYVVLVIVGVDKFLPEESTKISLFNMMRFIGWVVLWSFFLFRICVATGGKPKWWWGKH